MGKRIGILAIALCVLLVAFTGVFAEEGVKGMNCGDCGRQMAEKMDLDDKFHHKVMFIMANAADIQLSDAQMNKIKALKIKAKKSLLMKDAETEGLALDLLEAMSKDEIDMNMVNGLIDKKYEIKKARAKEIVAACSDIRQILTAEQFKKLKDKWMAMTADKMKMMMGGKCQMGSMQKGMHKEQE